MMRRWKKPFSLLVAASILASVLLLLAYGLGTDPRAIPSPLIGREAPPFTLPLFDGGTLRLTDLRGKVVVLNFWASWCYPACWNEAPRLQAVWEQYRDQGVMLVGVNYQDREADTRAFIERFGKTYPSGPDGGSRIAIDYGVYGVPETFFIDRGGHIAHKHIGEIGTAVLHEWITRLLSQRGGEPSS
jgi:cytochrome c biogenesis protein CcmG/thiol:disulfide interchange protein DsbE